MTTNKGFCPGCAHQRCASCKMEQEDVRGRGLMEPSTRTSPPLTQDTYKSRTSHIRPLPPGPQIPPTPSTQRPPFAQFLPTPRSVRTTPTPPIAETRTIDRSSLNSLQENFADQGFQYDPPVPRLSGFGFDFGDYQMSLSSIDSQTPANKDIKTVTSKGRLVSVPSISKSAGRSTTISAADTSGFSLPVVTDKTLGQTSHQPDMALTTQQSFFGRNLIKEGGTVPSIENTLLRNHTSNSDVVDFIEPHLRNLSIPRTLSPLEYFAEDPTSYFEDISILSRRVINLHTNTLLRIEQSHGLSVLRLPLNWLHHINSSRKDHAWLQTSITDNIKIASAITSGVELLVEEGFCSLGYNIIVADTNRPKILNIVPVSMPSLTVLCDLLHELIPKLDSPGFFLDDGTLSITNSSSMDIHEIMCDVRELLIHIVSTLGLESSFEGCSSGTHRDSWVKICLLLNSTLSILHLSLLTFIRSHLDVTDVTPGGVLSGALEIPALNGSVLMAPRRLKCLNGFVKKPVWAFSSHPRKIDLSEVDFDGFYVSTSTEDFAQLWGPVKVQYGRSGSLQAVSIETRGGCLQQVKPTQSSTSIVPSKDETLCHWVNWLDVENLATLDNPVSIDVSKHLLIGAYAIVKPRRRGREIPSMQLSDYCQCPNKYHFNYDAFELTTRPPSWKLDARTVQISGGKYVTINIGRTYKFDAGWTLKDVIVETWLGSDTIEPDPRFSYISPRYLDYLVVLDISCCSGNARRISLWKLLNHINVRDFLSCRLNTDLFRNLANTLTRLSSVDPIADIWPELASSTQELLTFAFRFVLTLLKSTGIREDRILQVWDITRVGRVDGRKIDPRWVTMLEDNDRCATFAIMTTTCFQCQPSPPQNHTDKTHRETVICTQLCIKSRGTYQGSTHLESKQEKKQASGAEDSQKGGGAKFSSKWAAVHPSYLATSQFVNPARNARVHGEIELLEKLRHRQESRQAVNQEVNMSSERTSTLPQDSSLTSASPISGLRHFGEVTSVSAQQEYCVNASSSTYALKALNRHVMNLDFISGSGKTIGRLKLEPSYGPKRSINISRLSDESILTARWEPYDYGHGLLNSVHEAEKAWDGRAKTWARNSNSFLQKIFNLFTPQDDAVDAPLVTENIRLGTSKDGEKVVQSFIR
jgi:hypothetical protein